MGNKRSLNKVILVGNVGKEPEIRHIPNLDKSVAKFSLATTETYMDKNNEFKDITEWHNVVVWGKWQVQKVEKSVTKGTMVLVEGKIKSRKWEDKETGNTRSMTEIVSQDLVILSSRNQSGNYQQNQNYSAGNDFDKGKNNKNQTPPSYDVDSDIPYDEESDPF